MLNKDILIHLYNRLTQYDHPLIGKIRQTCKLFSYYPKGVVKVTREVDAVYYTLLVNGKKIWHRSKGMHPWTDGPAFEWTDLLREWWVHGKRHRESGPAIEYVDGSKVWYLRNKIHREDGPAIEYSNGDKYWLTDGKQHREDGPAVELANGSKEWYLHDKRYSESTFEIARKRMHS